MLAGAGDPRHGADRGGGARASGPGLNVLTGETGAGKSILLDCLGFVLGWRGRGGEVRAGRGRGRGGRGASARRRPCRAAPSSPRPGLPGRRRADPAPDRRRRRPAAGLGQRPPGRPPRRCARSPTRWSSCTASRTTAGCSTPAATGRCSTPSPAPRPTLAAVRGRLGRARRGRARARRGPRAAGGRRARPRLRRARRGRARRRSAPSPTRSRRSTPAAGSCAPPSASARTWPAPPRRSGRRAPKAPLLQALRWLEAAAPRGGGRARPGARRRSGGCWPSSAEVAAAVEALLAELGGEPGELERVEERLFALRGLARKHRVAPEELPGARRRAARPGWRRSTPGAEGIGRLEAALAAAEAAYAAAAARPRRRRPTAAGRLDARMARGAAAAEARARGLRHRGRARRARAGGHATGSASRWRPTPARRRARSTVSPRAASCRGSCWRSRSASAPATPA